MTTTLQWIWRKRVFDYLVEKMELKRFQSIVDLGCAEGYLRFAIKPKKYVGVNLKNDSTLGKGELEKFSIDLFFNIDTKEKWPFKDTEFELVVASQVLEHILNLEDAVKEVKRIAKSHILIGLPNDMRLDTRIWSLFGVNPIGIEKYGHCRLFDIELAKKWIADNFVRTGEYKIESVICFYTLRGQRHIPEKIKRFLVRLCPHLFAGEIYFLLKRI